MSDYETWRVPIHKDLKSRINGYAASVQAPKEAIVRTAVTEYLNKQMQEKVFPLCIMTDAELTHTAFEEKPECKKFLQRMPGLLVDRIDEIAKLNNVSRNQAINEILEYCLNDPVMTASDYRYREAMKNAYERMWEGEVDHEQ